VGAGTIDSTAPEPLYLQLFPRNRPGTHGETPEGTGEDRSERSSAAGGKIVAMSNPREPSAGEPNLGQFLQHAQRMQAGLAAAQQELAEARVQGSSGGGLVTATVDGSGELVGLVITRDAVDVDDLETLADLVVAAVRDATSKAQGKAFEKLGGLTGGLGDMLGGLGGLGGPGGLGGLGGAGGALGGAGGAPSPGSR
jgi:DNA-binding YbaB/EbfC family protein